MFFEQMYSPDRHKYLGHMNALMNKYFLSRKKCEAKGFISDCSGKVVSSHTISKKFLRKITSKDGHVYCFDDRLFGFEARNGKIGLKKVGISDASTCQLFCRQHDNDLFRPIEDEELIPDEYQCLRLTYRALMMERHHKESQFYFWNDMVHTENRVFDYEFSKICLESSRNALMDSDLINNIICSAIINNDVSKFRALRIYFKKKPGVLCAGAFFPEYDFYGSRLWGIQSIVPNPEIISINIVALSGDSHNNHNGVAIVSWFDNAGQNYCKQFIDSMHSIAKADVSNILIHTVFEFIENVCISPSWWHSREKITQNALLHLHAVRRHSPLYYKEMGIQYDNWNTADVQLWNGQNWIPYSFS